MAVALLLAGHAVRAEDIPELHLTLKDHVFTPNPLNVSKGQKIKIILTNNDPTPAEFESDELHREKVVSANSTITFFVGPLDAGTYPFFDDFHKKTTTGTIVAQ